MKLQYCCSIIFSLLLLSSANAEPVYEFTRKWDNPKGPVDGSYDTFGYSIAAVGENLLVGAYREDTGAEDAGTAYLFNSTGTLLTTFRNPTPLKEEGFGYTVAGFGDKVLIGAWKESSDTEKSGAVYLYESDGTLLQTFNNPTPGVKDEFGSSFAVIGANILISTPFDDTLGDNTGAAYLFNQEGDLLRTFFPSNPTERDLFGRRVKAISEDRFLVSALETIEGSPESGAVYIYEIDGSELLRIPNPEPFPLDLFGRDIAIVGNDTILVGASQDDTDSGISAGAAFLYDFDGNLLHRIENPTPENLDWFGRDVATVTDDTFIIGAIFDETLGDTNGAAYLFNTDGELLQTFLPPSPAPGTHFGASFATIGDRLYIGSHYDGGRLVGPGAVYEYRLSDAYKINGGGETYFEDFDVMGTNTGAVLPSGWSGEDRDGPTRSVAALGLNDGPAAVGDDSILGINNVGGSEDKFASSGGDRVATWKKDFDDDGFFGPGDATADDAADRALGIFRENTDDAGKLKYKTTIADSPLQAFTFEWDLEVWGGDPQAEFRGTDGGGFKVGLTVGDTSYYSATELLKPGELFDTAFDGSAINDDATLIDGNVHSRRGIGPNEIIEVAAEDGAVGNSINITFDANAGPETFGWTPSVDNVRLRALAPGDADANGVVDTDDLLTLLAANKFNQGVDGVTWAQGDFNADDQFNTGDLLTMLAFLSGQFPSDPYASEAGSLIDAVADVIVNSETGEVTVDLAGHTASAIIIESAAEIFNGSQPDWNTTSQFPSTLPGELGNVLFTSTATGIDELGVVISQEFLGRDKEFYLDDLDFKILIASDGGALTKGNVIVVPEPSTWLLLLTGAILVGWRQAKRSPGMN